MNTGKIVQISGPVIDVQFESGVLPKIREALSLTVDGRRYVMEVAQHVGDNTVRCVMLSGSEGLSRGMQVEAPGKTIEVPVGENTLGRMFNVLGDPIDGGEAVPATEPHKSIYRKAPSFDEQNPAVEILETGIKVIDLLEPYPKGGKIGLFGGAGVGKTVLIQEQKIYLAILALADNPPEGTEQSIEQGLETLCRFGSRELHMGLSCYCSKDCVRFEGLPQEYQQLRRQHRQNVACSCGLILPKKQSTSSLKPEFPKWAGMLSQGLGDAVRSEIHSYLNQLNQEGGLTPETLFQFHEHFLPLFLGAMQHWEKDQDIFSKVDYDAIMQAYASLPQMLQFVDFVTEYVENSASKGKCQGRSQIERILSYIQKNLTRNISRSEISKALYLNPEYLSRLFKREMGIGLAEYLIQERMRLAQSLLKNTSFSISIIASRVGYVNFSHFAKVFKQEFGVSPSEYRKMCDPQGK